MRILVGTDDGLHEFGDTPSFLPGRHAPVRVKDASLDLGVRVG